MNLFQRKTLFKCGKFTNEMPESVPVTYGNKFELQPIIGMDRLLVGADSNWIDLMLRLSEGFREPFGILLVLVVPRATKDAARFDRAPLSRKDVVEFCKKHKHFLEQDSRHQFWISTFAGDNLVLDQHNRLFVYSDLNRAKSILESSGFVEGPVRIPVPHSHHYHKEFDAEESSIMKKFEWRRTPLQDGDDE